MLTKALPLAGLAATLVLGFAAPAAAETVEVTASALNVRTGPGPGFRRILVVYRGRRYQVVGRSASWVRIRVGSREGWSFGRYLRTVNVPSTGATVQPPAPPTAGTAMTVTAGTLNVRSGPGTQYRRLDRLGRGARVTVTGSSGVWRRITHRGGSWVHGAYLAAAGSPPAVSNGPSAWDMRAPAGDYRRTTFRGARVNRRTIELVLRAERIMASLGHPGFRFVFTQGSYSRAVAASGGTHGGGGALDIRTRGHSRSRVDAMVRSLRRAGFAAWSRGRGADSFAPHIHAIAIGDREATSAARSQIRAYARGRNGLRNNALDPDRRLGREAPTWARRLW
jgi:uncharacterized protein YraI